MTDCEMVSGRSRSLRDDCWTVWQKGQGDYLQQEFGHLGELVGDTALMMAIVDRLLHHGEVFYLRGSSYRMRGKEPVTLTAKPDGMAVGNPEMQ